MTPKLINDLFAGDINRRIEEVIKVDQVDEQVIREEIDEYIATDAIKGYYAEVLDRYWEMRQKRYEGTAIWISGFFGSGKSSFAKMLGLSLANRSILGQPASELFVRRTGDPRIKVLLKSITEQVPTEAVIFDVSTDRGIRSANQTLTEIMYRLFLKHLGYASHIDLAELEITLEQDGRLDEFKNAYQKLFSRSWDQEKEKVALAFGQASRVMHELEPDVYPAADSWTKSAQNRADITPGLLAERCKELMARRRPGRSLMFVIDEVGQFVARDVQKMLDLQGVVQSLGRVGNSKMWVAVTSQEKLNELVGGLDDKRVELARLMDRFPLQVHLEPSDISEVTSKRVLTKNADAERALRDLFSQHRGRLTDNTRMSADIKLPELTAESFIDLYPLLPYQIDLIIQVVSGLRTQSGVSRHVGGANRTIIKLAQQLLIHPEVDLAGKPVGALVRLDQVYDLVAGNIASEIRGKIDAIQKEVDHPLAQPVAKVICLLQYVKSVHRTAENIAAGLHAAVDADSRLPEVKDALAALEKAHMIRLGQDGYRIPSPAEDDWERQRASLSPKPADVSKILNRVVKALWEPQPSHNLLNTKVFKAGLCFNNKMIAEGDMVVHLSIADAGKEYERQVADMRRRSQTENKSIFWAAATNGEVDRQVVEIFRSEEILSRKERQAQTKDETALVGEEKRRQQNSEGELRRLVKQALLAGTIYFRGNDRSPDSSATDVGQTAEQVLAQALPEVFNRFEEAAARVQKKDLESVLTTENLRGLTAVFSDLGLVHDQNGKAVFTTDSGPLAEVMARIQDRTSYGEPASGRYLTDEFAKEPFGWDFDVVRLFVACLLRAGKVEATSQGQAIESALSLEAKNTFTNNNFFRQATFRPKVGIAFTDLVKAVAAFKEVFGKDISEIEQGVVATAIREQMDGCEEDVRQIHAVLVMHGLPGADVLAAAMEQMRAIRTGKQDAAILTFNASYQEIKEAIKRASEITKELTEPRLVDLARARKALAVMWPFLQTEPDLPESCRGHAEQLDDILKRETFYRDFPAIDQHTRALEQEYQRRYDEAAQARATAYTQALEQLRSTPGWERLTEAQQRLVSQPLANRATTEIDPPLPIPQLRSEEEACQTVLAEAIRRMMEILEGGETVAQVRAAAFFRGGIETQEQLDASLTALRDACERLIGAGKKVLVQ